MNSTEKNRNTQNLLTQSHSEIQPTGCPKWRQRMFLEPGPYVLPKNGSLVHYLPEFLLPSLDSCFSSQR